MIYLHVICIVFPIHVISVALFLKVLWGNLTINKNNTCIIIKKKWKTHLLPACHCTTSASEVGIFDLFLKCPCFFFTVCDKLILYFNMQLWIKSTGSPLKVQTHLLIEKCREYWIMCVIKCVIQISLITYMLPFSELSIYEI